MRTFGKFLWRFMVIFSFIVNLVLVVVLLVLGLLIFEIKNQIAQPLVTGLHSSFVGLDQATIDWTIPVRDTIPVVLNIPLETDTIVVLNAPVPLDVTANITLPGVGNLNNARVQLTLPQGLELPVNLDLDVAVDQPLPVSLDVRAVIPLSQTQLHDPFENLRLLFEPLAVGLTNLPSDFGGAGQLVVDLFNGNPPNLLAPNDYSRAPWVGFSRTAGLDYALLGIVAPPSNTPRQTGIIPLGGIPVIDQQIRPDVYNQGGPQSVNQQAVTNMQTQGVAPQYYDGTFNDYRQQVITSQPQTGTGGAQTAPTPADTSGSAPTGAAPADDLGNDLGIMPTPTPAP